MKRLLNTLFVTRDDAQVSKDGESILVKAGGETLLRMPVHLLGGVVCLGRVFVTPQALAHCAENGAAVSFLSPNGRFLARVQGPVSGNVLLRRQQYRVADDQAGCVNIARSVLTGKIMNCRTVLRRAARSDRPDDAAQTLGLAADAMTSILQRLDSGHDLDSLRGLEGEAGAAYFGAFGHMLASQEKALAFCQRSRRPPLDPVNAMLSFVYTLLAHDVSAACQSVGLDPQVGFLHRDRPGRPSLALDLMEELRPVLADRLVATLINRRQVSAKDFQTSGSGAVTMSDACRKQVIVAYQERKKQEVQHAFLGEKLELGLAPHVQALLLARHLRGDLDAYVPYLHKG